MNELYDYITYEEDTPICKLVERSAIEAGLDEYGFILVRDRVDDETTELEFPDMDGQLTDEDIKSIINRLKPVLDKHLDGNCVCNISYERDGDFTTFFIEYNG